MKKNNIGLFGTDENNWRDPLIERLRSERLPFFDPRSDRQARGYDGIIDCSCAIFHLGFYFISLESHCDFSFLMGARVPTFYLIEPQAIGASHLLTLAPLNAHALRCSTLELALSHAIGHCRSNSLREVKGV